MEQNNLYRLFLPLFVFFNFAVISCDSNDEENSSRPSKRISSVEINDTYSTSFSYDSKGRVVNSYWFSNKGTIEDWTIDYQTHEIYNAYDAIYNIYYTFECSKVGYITSLKTYQSNHLLNDAKLEYDKDGYLISLEYSVPHFSYNIDKEKYIFQYSEGNLVSISFFESYGKVKLTYSNSPNTLGWLSTWIATNGTEMGSFSSLPRGSHLNCLYFSGLLGKPSKNLVQSCREEYYGDSSDHNARFRYVLNDEGDVTQVIATSNHGRDEYSIGY